VKPMISRNVVDSPLVASDGTETENRNRTRADLGPERSPRLNLRLVSAPIALVLLTTLFGAAFYQFVADVPNWTGIAALEHYRAVHRVTNPGTFFQMVVPATLLSLLVALVCNWRTVPVTRWRLAGALALLILTDVITFTFHHPRNDILFGAPLTEPPAYYARVVTEWVIGNYLRVSLILTAIVLVIASMIRIARDTAPRELRDSSSSGALLKGCRSVNLRLISAVIAVTCRPCWGTASERTKLYAKHFMLQGSRGMAE